MEHFFKQEKKYGLILKKDQKPSAPLTKNIFQDSDDDDDHGITSIRRQTEKKSMFVKKQVQLDIEKALKEDPNCFEYDKVYEQDRARIKEEKAKVKEDVKPKYIMNLIKAAETRKKRQEILIEKKVQKEREAEGDKYAGMDSYVSSSFIAKKREHKEEEERIQRENALEGLTESAREKNYVSFYGHILNQKAGLMLPKEDETNTSHQKCNVKVKQERDCDLQNNEEARQTQLRNDNSYDVHPRRDAKKRRDQRSRSGSLTPKRMKGRRNESRSPVGRRARDRSVSQSENERHDHHARKSRHCSRSPMHRDRRDKEDMSTRNSPDQDCRKLIPAERQESEVEKKEQPAKEQKEDGSKPAVNKLIKRNVGESFDDAKAKYFARKAKKMTNAIIGNE